MDVRRLSVYLPMDRRQALARGQPLPDRAQGAALLADVVGFTQLTHKLVATLGPARGAEELIRLLNAVHDDLIAQVHHYGGSVVGFGGDGLICWFDQDAGLRATACGLALQRALHSLASEPPPGREQASVSLKVAIAAGPVRRLVVGDPQVQCLDLLAGATLERLARVEQDAAQGEIVVAPEVAQPLGERLIVSRWRAGLGVVAGLVGEVPPAPWSRLDTALSVEAVRPFLLPPVYKRLVADQAEFLAELRPAVALFQRFGGLDYDGDDQAGIKLDAYVRWVQAVLGRYGGYLLQLTSGEKGNYLYASFGALTIHEDDPGRAIAAALALLRPPPDLSFITDVQVGLSQGRVRAGAYGSQTRRTYGAQGDEVNVAARLMQAAPPGEVRCSQRIYRAARTEWIWEALPPVKVKGIAGPLPLYRPLARRREQGPRLAGALVGRQAERATLARLLEETISGQRRVVLLEGEAGIGKSRLLAELAPLARESNAAWLEGAGQSIEQGTPYRAWRDLLAGYFGLEAQADVADALVEQQRRVREQVAAVDPALVERIPLLNDVLPLDLPETGLTRGFDPKLRRESLTWLVVDLLKNATQRHPLALVLEDAHWLDSLSWDLALAVGRALHDRPLLLLLALRPLEEPLLAAYTALTHLEGAETVRLAAMPPAEVVTLAAARLGLPPEALPTQVADLVRERAGGNPFFAEELAHALRDSGALVIKEATCTLAADLEALYAQVPGTVEGVVLSRIDRLPPEEQLTLKVAAVVGRSFLYRTVRAVHPRQVIEDLLRTHLDDLARRDLTPLEALEPELSYLFKHIIIQQVAYDTLLFAQRRELHRAVASWYEQAYAAHLAPYYPLLVYHWHGAEEVAQERRYARLAGEQAAAQYANAEAVAYLSRALALTAEGDLAGRYALLLTREEVYDLQGDREAQRQDLHTLAEVANALGDDRLQAKVALRQANYTEAIGDYPAAVAAAQETIRLAQAAQDVHLEAAGYRCWGRVLSRQKDFDAAQHQLERAIERAQNASSRLVEAESLRDLGTTFFSRNDLDQAQIYYEQALQASREIGDSLSEAPTLSNLGLVARRRADYASAREYHERALRIQRQIGDRRRLGMTLNGLGIVTLETADHIGALAHFEQALSIAREVEDRWLEGRILVNIGATCLDVGDYAGALPHLERSLVLSRAIGDRGCEGQSLSSLTLLLQQSGDYTAAQEYALQTLHFARDQGSQEGEAYALWNLGYAQLGLGNPTEAIAAYQQATDLCREVDTPQLIVEPLAGLAHMAFSQGDLIQAGAHVEEILGCLEAGTLYGIDEPFRVYLTCYQILQAAQDPRAWDILNTAHALLQERAAKIKDEALRHSFLENVSAHRELVAAYQARPGAP
ncbi:MAG: tetratricopeptide repeat protein [Anaerolineae bacterium]|nr:tetratricopeptide repeat protein [Anaerolineae bacterium]